MDILFFYRDLKLVWRQIFTIFNCPDFETEDDDADWPPSPDLGLDVTTMSPKDDNDDNDIGLDVSTMSPNDDNDDNVNLSGWKIFL